MQGVTVPFYSFHCKECKKSFTLTMPLADYDGRLEFASGYFVVQTLAEERALSVTEPADARRQSLELHVFARELDPAVQNFVHREEFQHKLVGAVNISRIAGKRHPPEGSVTLA